MADPIVDRLIIMNNLIKDISLGKLYIEDFYKDNGNPKSLIESKYNKFYTERENLLRQYREGVDYIVNDREGSYTQEHKDSATNISSSIATELATTTTITVRFTRLPSKTGSVK